MSTAAIDRLLLLSLQFLPGQGRRRVTPTVETLALFFPQVDADRACVRSQKPTGMAFGADKVIWMGP